MSSDALRAWISDWLGRAGLHLGGQAGWIAQVFVVVLLTALVALVLGRILARLERELRRSRNRIDDAVVAALRRPLRWLVWIVGVSFAAEIARDETGVALFRAGPTVRTIGVVGCLAWFLIRLVSNFEQTYVERARRGETTLDHATVEAIGKLLRVSVVITAALVMLQSLGYSVSGVLAFGGIGGIAVGFAAKDLLANFFGAFMIYLDRPFVTGDWIYSPDKDIEGTVESIGWRLTRIRRFDKRPIYVPNSVFTSIAVVNASRMTNRRIKCTVGIRYDDIDKLQAIVDEIEAMLKAHPDIDQRQTTFVSFVEFGPSSCDILVYTFTRTTQWVPFQKIQQDVLLKIARIIESHGAEIAFPTRTVHLHTDSGPGDAPEATARASA